jgi:hypothetical protein
MTFEGWEQQMTDGVRALQDNPTAASAIDPAAGADTPTPSAGGRVPD